MMGAKITDELIERVAIAMFDRAEAKRPKTGFQWSWNDFTDGSDTRLFWRGEARAALEAALTAPDKQEAVAWQHRVRTAMSLDWGEWREGKANFSEGFLLNTGLSVEERPLYSAPASDDALRAENERLREALETKPAAFEVLDHVNGTYVTTNEQAALATEFPHNGLYRRVGVKV